LAKLKAEINSAIEEFTAAAQNKAQAVARVGMDPMKDRCSALRADGHL
jgi:hypothetical protein